MRLTETLREAFVLAVMQDVPTEDVYESAKKRAKEIAVSRLPKEVQKLYATHPEYVTTGVTSISGWRHFYLPRLTDRDSGEALETALKKDPPTGEARGTPRRAECPRPRSARHAPRRGGGVQHREAAQGSTAGVCQIRPA